MSLHPCGSFRLGLRFAIRCAATAYWPGALHWMDEILQWSRWSRTFCRRMRGPISQVVSKNGMGMFRTQPVGSDPRGGKRLLARDAESEPGEWHHGWHLWSSSVSGGTPCCMVVLLLVWPIYVAHGSAALDQDTGCVCLST